MSDLTIPYSPGYAAAVRAWLIFLNLFWRKAVLWWLTFAALVVFLVLTGHVDWFVWLSLTGLTISGWYLVAPLSIRLLWAYKVQQLAIHELALSRDGMTLHGSSIRVLSPWDLYESFHEADYCFLLVTKKGLFSFIPKRPLQAQGTITAVRSVLEENIGSREKGSGE